jgi:hypothetical protein
MLAMKPVARVVLVLIALAGTAFVAGAVVDARASSSSEQVCTALSPGVSIEDASRIAKENGGWFRPSTADSARAGASGWNLICRCRVDLKEGVIAYVSKSLCIS